MRDRECTARLLATRARTHVTQLNHVFFVRVFALRPETRNHSGVKRWMAAARLTAPSPESSHHYIARLKTLYRRTRA